MLSVFLGSLGFICYFIYDVNSVTKKLRVFRTSFAAGSVLVLLGTIDMVIEGWKDVNLSDPNNLIWLFGAVMMFGLLIYTLFFALPFDSTYIDQSEQRRTYTEGVYALCRHPGVLWYSGMYLSIWGIMTSWKVFFSVMIYIGWNIVYIILQDKIIFPRTFTDYEEYKKITPFLIPDIKSVKRCIQTMKKGGRA